MNLLGQLANYNSQTYAQHNTRFELDTNVFIKSNCIALMPHIWVPATATLNCTHVHSMNAKIKITANFIAEYTSVSSGHLHIGLAQLQIK